MEAGVWVIVIIAIAGTLWALNAGATEMPGLPSNFEDKVRQISGAVAYAEGFWDRDGNILSNNIPARFHNPGDLGPGDAPGFTAEFHSGSNVVQFPDDDTGWKYLYDKWRRILSGRSHTYSLDDTFSAVAKKYAGDWYNWLNNVTDYLGVSPATTLAQWRDS